MFLLSALLSVIFFFSFFSFFLVVLFVFKCLSGIACLRASELLMRFCVDLLAKNWKAMREDWIMKWGCFTHTCKHTRIHRNTHKYFCLYVCLCVGHEKARVSETANKCKTKSADVIYLLCLSMFRSSELSFSGITLTPGSKVGAKH